MSGQGDQVYDTVRLILRLAQLILHDAALQIENVFTDRVVEVPHPVRLDKEDRSNVETGTVSK